MSALSRIFNKKKLSHIIDELKEEILPDSEEEDIEEEEEAEAEQEEKPEAEDPETEEEYPVVEREIHPAKIICPDCGGVTLEGLEFCDKCGGELQ